MVQNASSSVKGKKVLPGHNDQRHRYTVTHSPSADKMNKELTTRYKRKGGKKKVTPQTLTNEGGMYRGTEDVERGRT